MGISSPSHPIPTLLSYAYKELYHLYSSAMNTYPSPPKPDQSNLCQGLLALPFPLLFSVYHHPCPNQEMESGKNHSSLSEGKGIIFLKKAGTLLGNYPIAQANQASFLSRTYILSLTKVAPSSFPVTGPITPHIPLIAQAPICFTRQYNNRPSPIISLQHHS